MYFYGDITSCKQAANKMKLHKILFLIIFISFNSHSQNIIEEYGEREYSDYLNVELLHKVCDNLQLKFSDVYINKSKSINFQTDKTFFAIQYIFKRTKNGNLYTTKYLFANNSNGKVIAQTDNAESYSDQEAVQPSPSYILKSPINLSNDTIGVGVIKEESVNSYATISAIEKISIVTLTSNKLKVVLENYPIRESHGESNCAGNYEIENLDKTIEIMDNKIHGMSDLFITKKFTYENVIGEKENIKKEKYETEILVFDGEKYNFKVDNALRFIK